MKHLIIISLFLISSVLPLKVHAGAAGGGATEITQLVNMGELIPINISDAITALSTKGTFIKGYILDPIANALISSALQGASNDILSWVSGGFGGSTPLIVTNPEEYLKQQGLKSVKGVLGNIPSDTIFGDSIFNSLLTQYKGVGDIEGTITQLTKSQLPGLIQSNLCKDEKLTSLALGAVQNNDGTYDQQELAAKKTELWNYACAGSADDVVVAARLQDLNTQNPSIGGWDAWLAVTGGENEYTKSQIVAAVTEKKIEEEKQLNIKDLYDGLGALSERECTEPVAGGEGEADGCNNWITITPGDSVGETLNEALTSGMRRLENIMGDGSLTGMLQGFAISAITSGIKKALNSSGGGSQYNLPVVLPSSRPVVQDLENDPLKKQENLKPMNKQLTYYMTTLNNLSTLDTKYMSELTSYESRVNQVKDCTPAAGFYQNRMGRITPVKNSLTAEQAKIVEAKALVNNTQTRIDASNSSQEQGAIFNEYLSKIEDNGYPNAQTEGIREAEYVKDKFDVEHDTELNNWITTCEYYRQQQNQSQPTYESSG